MHTVNTDLSALLQSQNQIKAAIASIEATKASMARKYRQLSGQWTDKKYTELGQVLQECSKALNEVLKTLAKADVFVAALAASLHQYESVNLGSSTAADASRSFGANGIRSMLSQIFGGSKDIRQALQGVAYKPIAPAACARSEEEIIRSISGGDRTAGSCSSLALAYAGNRAGYVVFDFRDGQSREVFSSRAAVEQIANLEGVSSLILRGTDDTVCASQLMESMVPGREYYMATGAHAAVVRQDSAGHYQYLELQSGIPGENGWQPLTQYALYQRFGCEDNQAMEYPSFLIDLDSLQGSAEFLDLLGYINTEEAAQRRGEDGHVR